MDWKSLLQDLRSRGWTQKLIATEINASQAAISDISTGKTKEPAYSMGRALELLHASARVPAVDATEPQV